MTHNAKQIISFMVLMSYAGINFGFGRQQREYSAPEIGRTSDRINDRYINLSSSDVFTRAQRPETLVSNRFKVFLKEDELMQKIKQIHHNGLDNAALSTISLKQDINGDLVIMEETLTNRRDNLWIGKVCAGAAGGCGVVIGGASTQMRGDAQVGVAAAGVVIVLVGAYGWWWVAHQKEYLDKHIEEVQEMNKDWKEFFGISEKK